MKNGTSVSINAAKRNTVNREKTIIKLGLLTILIIIFMSSILHIDAVAKESYFPKENNAAEINYRTEVRDVLKSAGIKNSGVTMTKKSSDGMSIEYSVEIHMPEYIKLNKTEKENLMAELTAIELDVMNSSVSFSFS